MSPRKADPVVYGATMRVTAGAKHQGELCSTADLS